MANKSTIINPVFVEEQFVSAVNGNNLDSSDKNDQKPNVNTKAYMEPVEIIEERGHDTSVMKGKSSPEIAAIIKQKTMEMEGFVIIDYRDEYKNTDAMAEIKSGIGARFANRNAFVTDSTDRISETHQTTYEDVMASGLYKINKSQYFKAIENFDFILIYFPEDQNALFFKALCLEQLGEFDKAFTYFNNSLLISSDYFGEATNYHRAQCLYKENKIQDAIVILNNIFEGNGYYSKRASELLGAIKANR